MGPGLEGLSVALVRDDTGRFTRLAIGGVREAHIQGLWRLAVRPDDAQIQSVDVMVAAGEAEDVRERAAETIARHLAQLEPSAR